MRHKSPFVWLVFYVYYLYVLVKLLMTRSILLQTFSGSTRGEGIVYWPLASNTNIVLKSMGSNTWLIMLCHTLTSKIYSFWFYVYGFLACMYACELCACLVPAYAGGVDQIPWTWSSRQLWVTMLILTVLEVRVVREKQSRRWRSQMVDSRGRRLKDLIQVYSSSEFCAPNIILLETFQVTNQMISACKAHITNNGTATIWSQPQDIVTQKILSAIQLKQVMASLGW